MEKKCQKDLNIQVGDNMKCRKCGHAKSTIRYCRGGHFSCSLFRDGRYEGVPRGHEHDHLEHTCEQCTYVWAKPPLDADIESDG